ncbi:hypothetical protein BJX99DRAFT_268966 [Aspergillus californicus]
MALPSTNDLAWKATTPRRWERDIDEAEQFYTSLAKAFEGTGRTFFAITGFVSFSVPLPAGESMNEASKNIEEALQKAWVRLRYDHPTIGSRVQYNLETKKCKKVYETFSASYTQQDWLDETFKVISEGVSGQEWCNSDPPVPDLPTLFLVKTETGTVDEHNGRTRADLVLRAHHDIIDGMGTLLLFNNLFSHAARAYDEQSSYTLPKFGDEIVRLSPPLRVAASIPPSLHPQQAIRIQEILEFNAKLREDVEIASLPFKRDKQGPGKHQRVAITLSREETQQLLAACRDANLSITHAYHTAIALVVRDLQERHHEERRICYINYSLINERAHCVEPYSTSAHPASVYHSVSGRALAIELTVPGSSSPTNLTGATETQREYIHIADKIRAFYLDIRNDEEHISLAPAYWNMATIPYPGDGKTLPVPPRNESPSVSISSMGVLDKVISHTYGLFEVEDPWVTGEELGTGLGLFLGSWKGGITLSAAYNDAWHDREEVLEILERCNRATLSGLGV